MNNGRTFANFDEVKEALRERMSLVDYIGKYVSLEHRGRHYVGLCPFHSEKTPSFTVTPEPHNSDVSMWNCFGCGKSGDLYRFVMEFHAASFTEAIEIVAEVTDTDLEPYYRALTPEETFAEMMRQQAEAVAQYLHEQLLATPTQLLFFVERGITEETLRKFKVGYCASIAEVEQRFGTAVLDYIDPHRENRSAVFDHNIVYPQFTAKGRIWGFYGRTGGKPKYRGTSGDAPLFQGVGRLYGFHIAKQIVRRTKQPFVIVEGFNDTLAAHQCDLAVVALCGTTLATDQVQALSDNTVRECVFILDGDQAGLDGMITIAKRAHEIKGTNFKFARITGDPDEFIADRGADAFRQVVEQSSCAIEFVITTGYSLNGGTATAQLDFLHKISPELLAYPRTSVYRELGIKTVAQLLGITCEAVADFLEQFGEPNVPANMRGEQVVLAEFVQNPQAWVLYPEIRASDFFFIRYRRTFELAHQLYQDGSNVTPDLLAIEAEARGYGKHVLDTIEQLRTVDRTQVGAFIIQIREKGDRRAALALAQRAQALLNDPSVKTKDTLGILGDGVTQIVVGDRSKALVSAGAAAHLTRAVLIDKMMGVEGANGLKLGDDWSFLMDVLNGGFQKKKVYIIAALSGVGKSLIGAANWPWCLSVDPKGPRAAGFIASMEMTTVENMQRITAIDSGVPHQLIERGIFQTEEQEDMVAQSLERIAEARLHWMEGIQSMRDIYSQARALKAKGELEYIVIDYVQLLDISIYGDRTSSPEAYGKASQDMHMLCETLDVPVIAMAQMNRNAYDVEVATGEQMGSAYKIYQDCNVCYTINPRKDGLFGYVDKNRSGQKNVGSPLQFDSNRETSNLRIREAAAFG